jgi:ferredoxin--NADP+ reductase
MTSPAGSPNLDRSQVADLRQTHYNATLQSVIHVHDDLRILRIVPDGGRPTLTAGQFFTLGLGNWEPRLRGVDEEHLDAVHEQRLAKRAYSLSCSLLDDDQQLKPAREFPYLEFYINLIRHADKHPPALTPRLFALEPGDRLFLDPRASGRYTLEGVPANSDIFFFATGTGEAPHNAMLADLLTRGHQGRLISAVSVRRLHDAAYRLTHEELQRRYQNYRYLLLITRETLAPANAGPCYVGRQHLQDLVKSGQLESLTGATLNPTQSHIFLCGSPTMIGAPHSSQVQSTYAPGSMLDLLHHRGFECNATPPSTNVHYERYW